MFSLFFSPVGRIGRGQWWLVQLAAIPLLIFAALPFFAAGKDNFDKGALGAIGYLVILIPFLCWFNFCSTVKRYHDRGKSGFWFLICLVPYIGSIWQMVDCGCLAGEQNDNQYGPMPGSGGGGSYSYDNTEGNADTNIGNRYDQAIQTSLQNLNGQNQAAAAPARLAASQQYHDRPRGTQPVFGRRV